MYGEQKSMDGRQTM